MRFKSVLGAFLFLILASFLALIVFVQTKSFGKLVTKVVTDLSENALKTKVQINNISLSVFPPGLELNQVGIVKKISEKENLEAELGKIGFYIQLIEIEEKKITFGEIKISDSFITYTFPKSEEELKELNQKLIEKIFEIADSGPLRIDTLILENTHVVANHDLVDVRRLKVFKKDKSFVTRFHLSNIKPAIESDFILDEIWGDGEISRENIEIYKIRAQHDVHSVLLKGKIQNYYKLKNADAKLVGEANLHLQSLGNLASLPEIIQIDDGQLSAAFDLNYAKGSLSGKADLYLENLKSNLIHANVLKSSLVLENGKLSLEEFSLADDSQKAELLEPVIVYNMYDKKFLTQPLRVYVEKLKLSNALRFLGRMMDPLRADLTGNLRFHYSNGDLFFNPENNFVLRDLALVVGKKKDPFTILHVNKVNLRETEISFVNNEFQISANAELARSKLQVKGFINKTNLQFDAKSSVINLEDFGNISNLDIKGAGNLDITVSGRHKTAIVLKGKTKRFEILGYRLGETEKDILIDLDSSDVVIRKMESRFGKTNISGTGTVNYKDLDIALGITSNDTNASDLSEILHPIFKDLKFLPADLDYKAKVDVDIFGKTRMDELKLRSKINFNELRAYGETIPKGSVGLTLQNRLLVFKDLEAEKGRGRLNGDFQFHLKDRYLKLNYQWDNLELASFNSSKKLGLNLNSTLSGKISGSGRPDNYIFKLDSIAYNTKTTNFNFQDSDISLLIRPDRIGGSVKLFGNILVSDFDLSLKKGRASRCNLKLESNNIKPIFVALFGQYLEGENFSGKIHFEGNTVFEDGLKNLNLEGNLKEFVFHHPDFNVDYVSRRSQFLVKESRIQRWDLDIKQSDFYVDTRGGGVFGQNFSLYHEINTNSKLAEILSPQILSSEGKVKNIIKVDGNGTSFDITVNAKSSGINMTIEGVPVPINELIYDVEYSHDKLLVKHLTSSFEGGTASIKGDVFFDSDQPDVNLKFNLEKAEFPILEKSSVNLTGEGILLGNTFPYSLSGEFTINKAEIVNELNDFSSKSSGFSQVRFLPKNQESSFRKMILLNVNVKAENPIRITNSLMDIALKGEVRFLGTPSAPLGEGRLFSSPGSSRIFFKNSEYIIQSADINFNPKKEISNPDFDVRAMTIISNYKVYPKAYGDLERFTFDLSSEPGLPRNSILSLIAFGYTQDIQNTLAARDQQSLTQVGVGSFVFDRFKISDILNKQFGLQINLGTVIEQSGTDSLLSGRAAGNDGGQAGSIGRTRSATKIELKKRLDEALTLSVSSTMGGTIGQRQSMNLNYGLNKNIQVEGVYELRSNEEAADINYNSIGGDIKFRRTFK